MREIASALAIVVVAVSIPIAMGWSQSRELAAIEKRGKELDALCLGWEFREARGDRFLWCTEYDEPAAKELVKSWYPAQDWPERWK